MRFKKSHLLEGLNYFEIHSKIQKQEIADSTLKSLKSYVDLLPEEMASLTSIIQELYNAGFDEVLFFNGLDVGISSGFVVLAKKENKISSNTPGEFVRLVLDYNDDKYVHVVNVGLDNIAIKSFDDPLFKIMLLMVNQSNIVIDVWKRGLIENRMRRSEN